MTDKYDKETFYKGLKGTDTVEVLAILSCLPLTLDIFFTFRPVLKSFPLPLNLFLEIGLWILPVVASYTAPSREVLLASVTGYAVLAVAVGFFRGFTGKRNHPGDPRRLPFISQYRALMMISTLAAILAVDFPSFPRQLAKTETYGISLMDVGVGTFQFAGALTSRHARGLYDEMPLQRVFRSAAIASLPAVVLGLIRLSTVKAANYHEHVSEYGVHWNFFFTLAAVNIVVSLLNPRHTNCLLYGLLVLGGYQYFLSQFDGNAYLLSDIRTTLVDQNKEGVYSTLGYVSIFLIGSHVGWKLQADRANQVSTLLSYQLGFWLLYGLSLFIDEPSRRMANMPYVFHTVAANLYILSLFAWINNHAGPPTSRLLEAVNRNQLALFLCGNLLTGAVNLSVNTLHVEASVSQLVLLGYLLILAVLALALDWFDITVKFW